MSKIFKIVMVLLIIATVCSAVLAVIGFMAKEQEYAKRLVVEDKLSATLKEKRSLEKQLDTAKTAKEEAEAKIAKTEEKLKQLSSQVDAEKQKAQTAVLDLEAKKAELAKLKTDLESEKKEKTSISKKLSDLQTDYDNVKKEVTRLNNEKVNLEKRMTELQEKASINLDKIVVNSPEAGLSSQTKPILQGKVLVVNKEYSFIVTDLGQDKGIQKGVIFDVMDGNTLLGKAEIDKVYDTMSSAAVLPGGRINDMKKGNVIIESR